MANVRSFWDDIDPEQLAGDLDAAQAVVAKPEVTFLEPDKAAEFRRFALREAIRTVILVLAFPVGMLLVSGCISWCMATHASAAAPPEQSASAPADQPATAPADQPAPGPVFIPEMAFGDPATLTPRVYDETIHFQGDPKVLEYNVKAAAKNVVPGTVMWAERWPSGVVDVHLLAPNGPDATGDEWYYLRHEFYQCRQWGGPYAMETTLNASQDLEAVKMPREMRYRAGSSKKAAPGR